MESLHGQVAIVTGAARGIGLGIATVLRDEGADVVVADLDEAGAQSAAAQLAGAGEHALGLGVDVTQEADTARMAADAISRWGRIDILVANAGIYPHIPLAELRVADFDRIMAVNVRGALLAMQACLPQMISQGYGRIVLTSSITGSVVGQPGYAHYGATKAAMLGLMRSAAVELATAGVTINAVLPGNIAPPASPSSGLSTPGGCSRPSRSESSASLRMSAGPSASWPPGKHSYITGQTLIIDGGQVLPESGD